MRTINVIAWEVMGRWQMSVHFKDIDEHGNLLQRADRSATASVPEFENSDYQVMAVCDSAHQMVRSLGLVNDDERLRVALRDSQK